MFTIKVYKDETVLSEHQVVDRLTIGRNPDRNLQLEDGVVSREHAEVFVQGGKLMYSDKSSNGTVLNNRRVQTGATVELFDKDRLELGGFELLIRVTADDPKSSAARAPVPEPAAVSSEMPKSDVVMSDLLEGKFPVWSKGTVEVIVADILDEAPGVKTYRFVGKNRVLFSYQPGQFITLIVNIDGEEVKRSYSMSSTPSRPHVLEITVKRVSGGRVSNWLADNLKLGDTVKIGSPAGKFSCFKYPSRKMFFIGAGSGCTPLMSMTRWIVDTTADVDVKFLVSARTPSDVIFHRELEYLSSRHSGFNCAVTITSKAGGSDPWLGHTGRVCKELIRLFVPDLVERHVFMCGPIPFAEAVKAALQELGFPMANLHTESFGGGRVGGGVKVEEPRDVRRGTSVHEIVQQSAAPVVAAAPAAAAAKAVSKAPPSPAEAPAVAPAIDGQYLIRFKNSGIEVRTTGEASLLELAENNGVEIDYACRSGHCGTCMVRCVSGTVEMSEEGGIDDGDKAEKYVLTCVGMPQSDVDLEI